jgi:hypothetical protein
LKEKLSSFTPQHARLEDVLQDRKLASLGDSYVNFISSLALSEKRGEAAGTKVSSRILSQALKKSKLRIFLPKRVDRHTLGDAAEALIVYAWLREAMTIEESVKTLLSSSDVVEAFASLLLLARKRLNF